MELWNWFSGLADAIDVDVQELGELTAEAPFVKLLDQGTGQLMTHAVAADVTWGTVEYDTDGWWDAGTPTRITPDIPGLYIATCTIWYPGLAGGYDMLAAGVRKNGSTLAPYVRHMYDNINADAASVQVVVEGIELNGSTDYVTGVAEQRNDTSSSVNLVVSGVQVSCMTLRYQRTIPN